MVRMTFKVTTENKEQVEISDAELLLLFVKDASSKPELSKRVDELSDSFKAIFPIETLLEIPAKALMRVCFLLGYQYGQFESKNQYEYIANTVATTTDNEESK